MFGSAPFKVVTPPFDGYYYVLLRSVPENEAAISLFIHAGETVEIFIPLGSYEMYFATGTVWYGMEYLFGPDTRYSKADDVFVFYETEDNVFGHTIELTMRIGGNLSTITGSEEDFHGIPANDLFMDYEVMIIPESGGIMIVNGDTYFSFSPEETGMWVFFTDENSDSDPYIMILDSYDNVIAYDDDSAGNLNAFIMSYLKSDVEYRIFVGFINSPQGSCLLFIVNYEIAHLPDDGGDTIVDEDTAFLFTPESSGLWEFRTSDNGISDPVLSIFDSDGNIVAEDDDSGDGLNAHIIVQLEADITYIVHARYFMESSDDFLLIIKKIS
jgi:hypothetical protein